MTNLIALRGIETKNNQPDPFLIMCADGMSSSNDGSKQDSVQKLFQFGDSFLMGTGYAQDIKTIVSALKTTGYPPNVDSLADKVVRISEQSGIKDRPLIVVAGGKYLDGRLALLGINASGYARGSRKTNRIIMDRTEQGIVEGSGYPFVRSLLEIAENKGLYFNSASYANAIFTAYELARRGAASATVNTALQYGIVTSQRSAMIISPEIDIDNDELVKYLNSHFSKNLQNAWNIQDDKDKIVELQKSRELGQIIVSFYSALDSDLSALSSLRRCYTALTQLMVDGTTSKDIIDFSLDILKAQKQYVQQGVEALVSGDPLKIVDYRRQHEQRIRDAEMKQLGV